MSLDRQLQQIEVWANEVPQRAYRLSYGPSPATGLPRLTTVQQYGNDWQAGGQPLPSWSFDYTNAGTPYQVLTLNWDNNNSRVTHADFDGDGRQDFIQLQNPNGPLNTSGSDCYATILMSARGANGFRSVDITIGGTTSPYFTCTGADLRIADFNGDGLSDIALVKDGGITVYQAAFQSGTGGARDQLSFSTRLIDTSGASRFEIVMGDFDGNGRAEIMDLHNKKLSRWNLTSRQFDTEVFTTTGFVASGGGTDPGTDPGGDPTGPGDPGCTGPFCANSAAQDVQAAVSPASSEQAIAAIDINGDGRQELLSYKPIAGQTDTYPVYSYRNKVLTKISESPLGSAGDIKSYVVGDFNGDGAEDFARLKGDDASLRVYLSNGQSFESQGEIASGDCHDCRLMTGDVDGDGRTDIIVRGLDNNRSTAFMWRNGGGWGQAEFGFQDADDVVDLNGDGKADIVRMTGGTFSLSYSTGGIPDLLNKVTNPAGGVTTTAYAPSSIWSNGYLPFILQTVVDVYQGQKAQVTGIAR